MLKFLKRLPGRFLRITAVVGVIGMILAAVSTRISPVDVSFLAFFGFVLPRLAHHSTHWVALFHLSQALVLCHSCCDYLHWNLGFGV